MPFGNVGKSWPYGVFLPKRNRSGIRAQQCFFNFNMYHIQWKLPFIAIPVLVFVQFQNASKCKWVAPFCLFKQYMSENAEKFDFLPIDSNFQHLFSLNPNDFLNFKISRKEKILLRIFDLGCFKRPSIYIYKALCGCVCHSVTFFSFEFDHCSATVK